MIIPVRCISCGKPIGQLWEAVKKESNKKKLKDTFDKLGVERYCCRSALLTHVDTIDEVAKFKA